jgi:hypothetical protein
VEFVNVQGRTTGHLLQVTPVSPTTATEAFPNRDSIEPDLIDRTESKPQQQADRFQQLVDELYAKRIGLQGTNIDYLPKKVPSLMVFPAGRLPMWALSFMITQRPIDHARVAESLDCLARLCCTELFAQTPEELMHNAADMAELVAAMQTFVTRSSIYVLDSRFDALTRATIAVDEWEYINDQPDQQRRRGDCEDLSAAVMEQSWLLKEVKSDNLLVQSLQSFERDYLSLMCVIAMPAVGNSSPYYHVVVIKLDRLAVLAGLENKVVPARSRLFPPVMIEATSFTTSCPKYRSPKETSVTVQHSQLLQPSENLVHITWDQLVRSGQYGHVQTAFCPELLNSRGTAQIDFEYQGKLGVPLKQLLNEWGVSETSAIRAFETKADADMIEGVRSAFDAMPVSPFFYCSKQQLRVTPLPKRVLDAKTVRFSAWYRAADYNESVRSAIRSHVEGAELFERELSAGDFGSQMHVIAVE